MTKRFNIPGFRLAAVQTTPAPGDMAIARMAESKTKSAGNKRARPVFRNFARTFAVLASIALLICGGWYSNNQRMTPVPPIAAQTPTGYISNDQLEAQYGVRVTLIAASAAGGIVDFRYRVSDPVKAAGLLHDPANTPILTAVDTGFTLSPTNMGRRHSQMSMKRGAVPFTFYPNVRGAVKPGTLVSVAFGNIKVEPIAAQ